MKRLAILTALILGLVLASAMAQNDAAQPAAPDPATEAALEMLLPQAAADVSDADISYALGFIVGSDLKSQGIQISDPNEFASGLSAALGGGEGRMNPQQINATMSAFAMKMREQITKTKEEGQKYLAENTKAEGVTTTDSGLQIKTLKEGEGDAPKSGDIVSVHYEGKLLNGTVFDSSQQRGEPIQFQWSPDMQGLIPGWIEGVSMMRKGGKYELTIPAELAYGDRPNGDIPGGSTLIFTMELIDTNTPEPEAATPGAAPMPGQAP